MHQDENLSSNRKTENGKGDTGIPDMFFRSIPGLQSFAPNIWVVDGPNVRDMGLPFTTRMAIVRLSGG